MFKINNFLQSFQKFLNYNDFDFIKSSEFQIITYLILFLYMVGISIFSSFCFLFLYFFIPTISQINENLLFLIPFLLVFEILLYFMYSLIKSVQKINYSLIDPAVWLSFTDINPKNKFKFVLKSGYTVYLELRTITFQFGINYKYYMYFLSFFMFTCSFPMIPYLYENFNIIKDEKYFILAFMTILTLFFGILFVIKGYITSKNHFSWQFVKESENKILVSCINRSNIELKELIDSNLLRKFSVSSLKNDRDKFYSKLLNVEILFPNQIIERNLNFFSDNVYFFVNNNSENTELFKNSFLKWLDWQETNFE